MLRATIADGATPRPGALVLRAIRPDTRPRWITVDGAGGTPYEAVRDHGDPGGTDGVHVVDRFTVAPGEEATFLAAWDAEHERVRSARGHLGARLFRALPNAPEHRFVALERWSSPLMVARARGGPNHGLALYTAAD